MIQTRAYLYSSNFTPQVKQARNQMTNHYKNKQRIKLEILKFVIDSLLVSPVEWIYLNPKQLSLFSLQWLISPCANHIGNITNFCSLTELLHELKTAAVFKVEAFMYLMMSQQGKRRANSLLDLYKKQKIDIFLSHIMRILNSCIV